MRKTPFSLTELNKLGSIPALKQTTYTEIGKVRCEKILTLLAPRVFVPTPITKHQGEGGCEMEPLKYLKNDKYYQPETLGGILQGLKKFQVDITSFA